MEQSHVLNGDDRLIGEGLEECDLLIREGTYFGSANLNRADCYAFTKQRRNKNTPDIIAAKGVRRKFRACHVVDVDCLPIDHGSPDWEAAGQWSTLLAPRDRDRSMQSYEPILGAFSTKN